jgi:hypothetical protein
LPVTGDNEDSIQERKGIHHMNWGFFVYVLFFAPIFYYATTLYPRKKRAEKIQHRESLSPEEFYDKFYKDSKMPKEAVIDVLRFMKKNLFMPIDKLRPYDRFDKELAIIKELEVLRSDIDDFSEATYQRLSHTAQNKHINLEKVFKETKTIDDYIRMFITIETV